MRIEDWKFKDLVLLKNRVEISGCYSKLETENNASKVFETQGRLEGLKMGRDKIITEFGPMEGTMDREEEPPEINNISKVALEHFSEDIDRNREEWQKVSIYAGDLEDNAKNNLWNELASTVSRDMKRALGRKEGLRIFENMMDEITNTLVEIRENPELDFNGGEDNITEFPQKEFDGLEDGKEHFGDGGENPDRQGVAMGMYDESTEEEPSDIGDDLEARAGE